MTSTIGNFLLAMALVMAVTTLSFGIVAGQASNDRMRRWVVRIFLGLCFVIICANCVLVFALLTNDFSLHYVWQFTNTTLDPIYRFTALWGGQEGSMLFWCLILALTSAAVTVNLNRRRHDLQPYVIATLSGIMLFFLLILFFAENPFRLLMQPQSDGRGLNPLLQNFSMIIHPPCLYIGFVLCSVPFALTVAALATGTTDSRWSRETRVWTLLAWFFLTAGNVLGARWAYEELGWGGYWAWDPVENAAIMPWFTVTAYLHSIMVQEKRGLLKTWNFFLVAISFFLTILGTFITRSGLISSVHTFAQSNLGYFFLAFLLICLLFVLLFAWLQRRHLYGNGQIDDLLSKEGAFVFNNILLTIACFAILWGTMFPILSEAVTGDKVSVGPPFFNGFMIPLGLILLLLMGLGQSAPWRRSELHRLWHSLRYPIMSGILVTIASLILLKDGSLTGWYVSLAFGAIVYVVASIILEYGQAIALRRSTQRESIVRSLNILLSRAPRRFGGYVVHLGIAAIFFGIAGSAFKQEVEVLMRPGDRQTLGGYELRFDSLEFTVDPHKDAVYGRLTVTPPFGDPFELTPARFFYKTTMSQNTNEPQASTEVALYSTVREDLYTVLHSFNVENQNATFMFVINPLVAWLWIGSIIIVGGVIILLPWRRRKGSTSAAVVKDQLFRGMKEVDLDIRLGKMSDEEGRALKESLMKQIHEAHRPDAQLSERALATITGDLQRLPDDIIDFEPLCRQCGFPMNSEEKFCSQCGQKFVAPS